MEITILKISKIYWLLSQRVIYYIQTDKQVCKANINIIYDTKACPQSQLKGGEKYWKSTQWSRPPRSWQLARRQSGRGFGMERSPATRLATSGELPTRTSRRCSQRLRRKSIERTVKAMAICRKCHQPVFGGATICESCLQKGIRKALGRSASLYPQNVTVRLLDSKQSWLRN